MQARALRRFTHAGKEYVKNRTYPLPDDQFSDWKAAGLVEQAPMKAKTARKAY